MRKARVTINEVAAKARVHASTVSRVLNEETRSMVSKPVADRVLGVARKLGYLPNPLAAGLRTRRSRTIGVLIPDLTNPVFPPIVRGITQTLHDAGYVVVLADSNNDVREAQAIVASLRARHVDGLILATAQREDPIVEDCVEHGIPLVLVNRSADKTPVATVATDDDLGIHLALEHLIELGHRHIAFVGGPQSTSTGYVRYRAFLAAIKERGLDIDRQMIVNGKAFSEAAGKESLAKIIQTEGMHFTAVVAANDLLALGCFDALEEQACAARTTYRSPASITCRSSTASRLAHYGAHPASRAGRQIGGAAARAHRESERRGAHDSPAPAPGRRSFDARTRRSRTAGR